jgi:hypothetical protein
MGNQNCCTNEENRNIDLDYNIKEDSKNLTKVSAAPVGSHLPDSKTQGVRPIQSMNKLNDVVQEVFNGLGRVQNTLGTKYNHLLTGGPYLYADGATYQGRVSIKTSHF